MNDLAQHVARISNGWDDNPARAKSLHKEAYIDPCGLILISDQFSQVVAVSLP